MRNPSEALTRAHVASALEQVAFLALVGGDEFKPGNEEHDRLLVEEAVLRHNAVRPRTA